MLPVFGVKDGSKNGMIMPHEKGCTLAWQQAFDLLSMPVSVHDLHNKTLFVNTAFERTFGDDLESVIGLPCCHVVRGANDACDECPHRRTVLTKKVTSEEFYHPRLEQYLEITIHPICDDLGQVLGTIHYIQNITAARQMQVGFDLFKSLMTQSEEAIYVIDANSRQILDMNDRACRDTQYSKAMLQGMSIFDLEPSLQRDVTRNEYAEKLGHTGQARWPSRYRRRDGSFFHVEVHAKYVSHGDLACLLFRVRDVSKRIEAEALVRGAPLVSPACEEG